MGFDDSPLLVEVARPIVELSRRCNIESLRRALYGTGHEGQELLRRRLNGRRESREVGRICKSRDGIQSRIAADAKRYGLVGRADAGCVGKQPLDAAFKGVLAFVPTDRIGKAGQRSRVVLYSA